MANPIGNAFGLASLYDPSITQDQTALDRQIQMAKLLRAQGMAPLDQNRQIGGMGYAISPWESVAKLAQTALGGKMEMDSEKAQQELSKKQMQAMAAILRGGETPPVAAPSGLPANVTPEAMTAGGFPQPSPQAPQQAPQQASDPFGMASLLKGSAVTQFGGPEAGKAYYENLRTPEEIRVLKAQGIDPKDYGSARMAKARADALIKMGQGDTIYEPGKGVQFTAPDRPAPEVKALAEAVRAAGVDPASPQGQALNARLAEKMVNFPPANTVNVSTERTYSGLVASGIAKSEADAVDAGKTAPERIQNARMVKDLLAKNPITGTKAEARLAFDKALATAGLKNGDRVATTETLASTLASSTLDAIKTSGLGAGQGFTDKDRQFLERAKSGNIELNSQTLKTLADLNEKSATATIDRANQTIRKWKKNPSLQGMVPDEIGMPGGLSSAEQAELEALRKQLGK